MKNYKELIILLAEDDDGHAELIIEGLKTAGVCNKIIRFSNGKEAWQFLSDIAGKNENLKSNSYLLLLDINMPVMDGIEVLKNMKENELLKRIPVIMLTTTDDPREIEHCYDLGCSVYITKPIDFSAFTETLKRLGLFIQIVSV